MNPQKSPLRSVGCVASVLAASVLILGLAACGKKDEPAASQRVDPAVQKAEQAAADARAQAASAAQTPAPTVDQGAAAGQAPAPAPGGGMVFLDDAGITALIKTNLAADPELSALKINVDTSNGRVTLKGPAPSNAARDRAVAVARAVSGVSSVNNQLTVNGS